MDSNDPFANWQDDLESIKEWSQDIFLFAEDTLGMFPAEPKDSLRGKEIEYTDAFGVKRKTKLFDDEGRLVYNDLSFYTIDMFKNQDKQSFKQYGGDRFTWQQTVILEAYNRAVRTFDKDSFDASLRWITTRSGHGIGKTGTMSIVAIHFLYCFFGSQIGMTANTEQQVKDIFMKEFYVWKMRLPDGMQQDFNQVDDHIRIGEEKDWFLRAQVARPEKPEALAGLHAKYVLILVDEASGVSDKVFEVMKGALTGENFIVMYYSNPTRTEGEFFESHKKGSRYTKIHFSSLESPIVKDTYAPSIEADYGKNSDEYKIRVLGDFASVAEMDDKGWIPLFANLNILFEPERGQIINSSIMGVDPAGQGRDYSVIHLRDNIYLKEVLREATSNPKDLARKIELIRDAYQCVSNDIAVDGFGIGAEVVQNVQTKVGESVNAILTDRPREGTEKQFSNFKAELAWKFREWVAKGGIIITNNPKEWLRELAKIKMKRDLQGRIHLMGKVEFKKEHGFSPDRFDAAIYTFFRDEPTRPVVLTKVELENMDMRQFMERAKGTASTENPSSM